MVIGGPPFPHRPSDLSAEFLSAALGADVAEFTLRPLGQDRGMMGDLVVVDLVHRSPTPVPTRLVAKFSADRPETLITAKRARTHERELRFYDELAAVTPVRVPTIYGSWYDPQTARFLLLQELVEGEEVDQLTGISADHAVGVVEQMARLHARWWDSSELAARDWLVRLTGPERRENLNRLVAAGWPALEALMPELSSQERAFGAELPLHLGSMFEALEQGPATLVHSDLRVDNLMFVPSTGEVVLLDWQGCCWGAPALDLAYFISQGLDGEIRREVEDDLLHAYRDELRRRGVSVDSDQLLAGFGPSMAYGLVIAAAIPLISDPEEPRAIELARSMAARAFSAMADHGVLA